MTIPVFFGAAALLSFCAAACSDGGAASGGDGLRRVAYVSSDEAFPNPERGFYYPYDFRFAGGGTPEPLSPETLRGQRRLNRSLVLLEYFLRDFIDRPLSEECLELVERNFEALREGGCKAIVRFAYSDSEREKPWDAAEPVVLGHIAQLRPLLQRYGAVICVLQAGFVGVWGEWYYTDHFGFEPVTETDYASRRRVLDALLDALPADRMVAVRTPVAKMRCCGLSPADTVSVRTAWDGSARSRVAAHNDCFLASRDDMGTFVGEADREFWRTESRYVSMGGETCSVSEYCDCTDGVADMEEYHWSYLNSAYHPGVIARWRQEGCLGEIERRLGYRFVLETGRFTRRPVAGGEFVVGLELRNEGFASPFNLRPAKLVLTDASGRKRQVFDMPWDPRRWFAGKTHTLTAGFAVPPQFVAGDVCTLWLWLPDADERLAESPCFSIRLANEGIWDAASGYNRLLDFELE